jgi:predicted MPP superfamily phosphohydrolase
MNAVTAYLLGLITFLPTLLIQGLISRGAAHRWPRLRWLFYGVGAVPLILWIAGFPAFRGAFRAPTWLQFAAGFWLYAAVPAYFGYKLVEWSMRAVWRTPKRAPGAVEPVDMSRRDAIRTASMAVAAVPVAVGLYGTFIERTNFGVQEVAAPIPNLPAELEGLRILQLSDVHRSPFLSQKLLTRVVDAAHEIRADLIFHTGDFISSKGDPIDDCLKELARLHGSGESFGCMGNHEVYAEAMDYLPPQAEKLGIQILQSSARLLKWNGALINIAGVDYQSFADRKHYLQGTASLVVPGAVNILLSHNPDVFPLAARMGFDLTVSGHTHGGQVRTEILHQDVDLARVYTPFVAGLYRSGGRSCYVTRGIGSIGMPTRLGAPPEITVLRLTRAEST